MVQEVALETQEAKISKLHCYMYKKLGLSFLYLFVLLAFVRKSDVSTCFNSASPEGRFPDQGLIQEMMLRTGNPEVFAKILCDLFTAKEEWYPV